MAKTTRNFEKYVEQKQKNREHSIPAHAALSATARRGMRSFHEIKRTPPFTHNQPF